jgi:hypothetical protein
MFFGKKSPHKTGCMIFHMIIAVLLFLAMIAALVGVYMTHFLSTGLVFGTTSGSLAITAFAIATAVFIKAMKSCCDGKCACNGK